MRSSRISPSKNAERIAGPRQRRHRRCDAHDRPGIDAGIQEPRGDQFVAGHLARAFDVAVNQPGRRMKTHGQIDQLIEQIACEIAACDMSHLVTDGGGQYFFGVFIP